MNEPLNEHAFAAARAVQRIALLAGLVAVVIAWKFGLHFAGVPLPVQRHAILQSGWVQGWEIALRPAQVSVLTSCQPLRWSWSSELVGRQTRRTAGLSAPGPLECGVALKLNRLSAGRGWLHRFEAVTSSRPNQEDGKRAWFGDDRRGRPRRLSSRRS